MHYICYYKKIDIYIYIYIYIYYYIENKTTIPYHTLLLYTATI